MLDACRLLAQCQELIDLLLVFRIGELRLRILDQVADFLFQRVAKIRSSSRRRCGQQLAGDPVRIIIADQGNNIAFTDAELLKPQCDLADPIVQFGP